MTVLPKSWFARIVGSTSILLSLALLAALAWTQATAPPQDAQHMLIEQPNVEGSFALEDTSGQRVSDRDFRGEYMLVYFGYSNCGDHCVSSLNMIDLAMSFLDGRAPEKAERLQPIFITLDPERDDPETLDAFLDGFDDRILGLRGDERETAEAAASYDVYFARLDDTADAIVAGEGEYRLSFASFLYVIDPDGDYVGFVSPTDGPTKLAERLLEMIEE